MTATPNAEKTVEALEKMLATYGLPNFITTDNGPQLISQYFKQYCETPYTSLFYVAIHIRSPYFTTKSVLLQLFRDDPRVLIQELVREALLE
jgi:hypothetical protein